MTTVDVQEPSTSLPAPQPRQASHLRLVPDTEPRQLSLAYEYEVAPGVPADPRSPRHLHLVPDADEPAPSARSPLPPVGPWAANLARAIAEVAAGERPPGQLSMHVTREQLIRLTARGRAVQRHPAARGRRGPSRRVSGVRVCPVGPGVVETSAVLVGEHRSQAIAMRLEAMGSQWIATVVDLI